MTSTLYSDLEGAGTVIFESADLTGYWHTKVTDLGMSHPVDSAGLVRYLDLGWIAPIEVDPDSANGMTGTFVMEQTFLTFQQQTFDFKPAATDLAGFAGFAYAFRTGVIVDVTVGIP